jgi:hypothetical protein
MLVSGKRGSDLMKRVGIGVDVPSSDARLNR